VISIAGGRYWSGVAGAGVDWGVDGGDVWGVVIGTASGGGLPVDGCEIT